MTCQRKLLLGVLCTNLVFGGHSILRAANENVSEQLSEIVNQNRRLQQQVQEQQQQIDELRLRLDKVQQKTESAETAAESSPAHPEIAQPVESPTLRSARQIRLSGEVGLAYFSSGRDGAFPHSEFRVDEARIYLEAPIWKNVYFFTALELTSRENDSSDVYVGELFADIEDLLVLSRNQRLSLRVGRFNIPFGEEYQTRNVMTNPLITHSVADVWGIDEGVQIYGSLGPLQYNLAVQNGGSPTRRDFTKDKSVTVRIGFDASNSLHLSISGHRTGKLDAANDSSTEIWFGGEYLGPVGALPATRTFDSSLLQLDATWRWKQGHASASAGNMWIDDDEPATDNSRRARYYSIEVVQQITSKLYAATRFGEIRIPDGYPLVGLGDYGKFYYASPPTVKLDRLSLGLGYRFAEPLVWKMEYSWEDGRFINGVIRKNEDLFSTEIGLKF